MPGVQCRRSAANEFWRESRLAAGPLEASATPRSANRIVRACAIGTQAARCAFGAEPPGGATLVEVPGFVQDCRPGWLRNRGRLACFRVWFRLSHPRPPAPSARFPRPWRERREHLLSPPRESSRHGRALPGGFHLHRYFSFSVNRGHVQPPRHEAQPCVRHKPCELGGRCRSVCPGERGKAGLRVLAECRDSHSRQ